MEIGSSTQNDEGAKTGLEWKEMFERTTVDHRSALLKTLVLRQLQYGAISSYRIIKEPILNVSLHDTPFETLVLSPLEWFLFGEEPAGARRKLTEINKPPTLCAKIFKNGEPTYSCRDCALDATCVLCMTCFSKSIHKDHNYRLSTSGGGGGGCCDCGDVEAWKQGAACELHTAPAEESTQEDPFQKLSQEFLDRVGCLFSILLDYSVKLICHPNDQDLLPELMSRIPPSDGYLTVLYNDESHTFDDVIAALNRSVPGCETKLANDFATIVDREGRATVCVGSLELCDRVRVSIQDHTGRRNNSGPLRCETAHMHLFACQLVALRLMKWLSDLAADSDCLRRLHCMLCTASSASTQSHLVQALHADGRLWKVARAHTQQLFMNTLLKDPEGKTTFGIEFTKNYPTLVNDFYADDQEHTISATAMSVQLFTVPSLSQMLVVNHDLLEILITVLLEKTKNFVGVLDGIFDFQKDDRGKSMRLYWVIHDMRYVLQNKPNDWNDILKEKFLRFLELFLSFYKRFQGMASMVRATGVHVEMEPDWARDFELQMRLIEILPLITKWCESDRDVLIKSISLTIKCLKSTREGNGGLKLKRHSEGKKSFKILDFDVASGRVSIHIPILRFLSGLIGACEKHALNITNVLEFKKTDDMLMYLEYPLKVLVLVAQVRSGMWKKNGFSVRNQVRVYQSDISEEMYDKDVVLVQALASCLEKDHFLVILLDMFKLVPWASVNFDAEKLKETTLSQELSLAAEFLHLLIIILGERYKHNVGQVDAARHLRREVIHRLCLGTMSRSELMRALPVPDSEYVQTSGIDGVILSVATFKKPGLSSKGLYKLKKEYLGEFNPFFYHYTKNEQSKAEDEQRKRCKEEGIPAVFAPPVPVEFSPLFANVVDLLRCDKLVELLTLLLWRVRKCNPKSWTDRMFHEVLHLIGLALHEEARAREKNQSFGFLNAAKKHQSKVHKHSLIQCLEALKGNPIIEAHSQLLQWTIKKFNELCSHGSAGSNPEVKASVEMSEVKEDTAKVERQRLARERKHRILMQMSNMQKAFIRENAELFLATNSDDTSMDQTDAVPVNPADHVSAPVIAIGRHKTPPVVLPREQMTCILCQESPTANSGDRLLVFSTFVQRSTVISRARGQTIEEGDNVDPLVSHRDNRVGVHMSSCGHVMHGECWQRYFESLIANERLSLRLRIHSAIDLSKREFLCPLCGGFSNAVLPVLPLTVPIQEERVHGEVSWPNSFRKLETEINQGFRRVSKPPDHSLLSFFKETLLAPIKAKFSVDVNSLITVFAQAAFTSGLNVQPNESDRRVPLMVWGTCAYTIQCLEHSSRNEMKSLVESLPKREMDVLRSLVVLANSVASVFKPADVLSHCLRLISLLPGSEKLPDENRPFMDIDLFDWMVKIRFSYPTVDYHANAQHDGVSDEILSLSSLELDEFAFHLALAARITQVLLTTEDNISTDDEEMDESGRNEEDNATPLSNLWGRLKDLCSQHPLSRCHPSPQRLLRHLQYRLLPFLRSSAVFYHILNSTRQPRALKETFMSVEKEFEALSEFLALPKNLTEIFGWNDNLRIFNDELVTKIVRRWCSNSCTNFFSSPMSSFSLEPNNLVELPNDYSELISQASDFDCPVSSGQMNRVPARCLVCGQMLCCEVYCCKQTVAGQIVGPCTAHALSCGAGIGIFLRVRDCLVLLINGIGKGCLYPPPYLDAYGETDPGLRRGNPLYLCRERYDRLQKLWQQHGIPSEIARHLETNRNYMSVDWTNY